MPKPQFAKDQDMMNVSPADVAEAKRRALNEAAFNAANRTPAAPVAPVVQRPTRTTAIDEAMQEAEDAKARKKIAAMGYSKGGSVSSASKRADGIAVRGKTQGKYL
jgi:hypothetical protein